MVIVTDLNELLVHTDTGIDLVRGACSFVHVFSGTAKLCASLPDLHCCLVAERLPF
jgi:hypothetical protein